MSSRARGEPGIDPRRPASDNAVTSVRRFRARRATALATLVALALGTAYAGLTLTQPLDPAVATVVPAPVDTATAVTLPWPDSAAGAVGRLGDSAPLANSGSTDALPIASISKVVTALVVLEALPLETGAPGPSLTVGPSEAALYGKYQSVNGKVEAMPLGSVLSERELLEVTLVVSANNYAEALADWAFGSDEAFTTAAKAFLDRHALAATTIVEPTGMSPQNKSSVTDLLTLARLALADPVVAEIVSADRTDVPGVGMVANSNKLLGIDGIDGIKTGTLEEAGACLLFSADLPVGDTIVPIVGVVLGAADHDSLDIAVRALLSEVSSGFRQIDLASEGEVFAKYRSEWGQASEAVATRTEKIILWSDSAVTRNLTLPEHREAETGDSAGTVTFTVEGEEYVVPLEFGTGISDPGPWWRLSHPLSVLPGI